MCTERVKDVYGRQCCKHSRCPFEQTEFEWWKDAGGKTLIEEK